MSGVLLRRGNWDIEMYYMMKQGEDIYKSGRVVSKETETSNTLI